MMVGVPRLGAGWQPGVVWREEEPHARLCFFDPFVKIRHRQRQVEAASAANGSPAGLPSAICGLMIVMTASPLRTVPGKDGHRFSRAPRAAGAGRAATR